MKKTKTDALVSRLFAIGVSEHIARELVQSNRQEVERQIEALPFRERVKNQAAYLINAVRNHYPLPENFQALKEKAESARLVKETRARETDIRETYGQMYHDYLRSELRLIEETNPEGFADFGKYFERMDVVVKQLRVDEVEQLKIVEFEAFIGMRPELEVLSFSAWCAKLKPDSAESSGEQPAEEGESSGPQENVNTGEVEWEAPAPFYDFDLPEFPVHVLPAWLKSFVESEASSTQTPISLAGMLSLAVCAAAVARKVRIAIRAGWQEPLNIFTAIALPPGNRKSQVVTDTTAPLMIYERKLIRESKEQIAKERTEYRILQGEVAELEKKAARAEPDKALELTELAKAKAAMLEGRELPCFPKLVVDDVTPEVLATIMAEQKGRIALFSAEGGIFDTLAGRYTNGMVNIDVVLKGHSGDDVRVDRKDRSESIEQPALTMGLAIQPDILRGLMEKPGFRGRGLIGRFLYSLPQSTLGKRKIRPGSISDDVRTAYHRQVLFLAAVEALVDEHGDPTPRLIRLSKGADDLLAAFEEEIEPMLGADGDLAAMSDWGGKLIGATVRIAGILHLALHADRLKEAWPEEVSAETLASAITIARYLIVHARMAYAEMGSDQRVEDAKHVLRWIERHDRPDFTKREVFTATKTRFRQVAAIEPVLKVLEDHGFIRLKEPPAVLTKGRPPGDRFVINPALKEQNAAL